jgi:hypothetical protein
MTNQSSVMPIAGLRSLARESRRAGTGWGLFYDSLFSAESDRLLYFMQGFCWRVRYLADLFTGLSTGWVTGREID